MPRIISLYCQCLIARPCVWQRGDARRDTRSRARVAGHRIYELLIFSILIFGHKIHTVQVAGKQCHCHYLLLSGVRWPAHNCGNLLTTLSHRAHRRNVASSASPDGVFPLSFHRIKNGLAVANAFLLSMRFQLNLFGRWSCLYLLPLHWFVRVVCCRLHSMRNPERGFPARFVTNGSSEGV